MSAWHLAVAAAAVVAGVVSLRACAQSDAEPGAESAVMAAGMDCVAMG